jgi:hypothetical protein
MIIVNSNNNDYYDYSLFVEIRSKPELLDNWIPNPSLNSLFQNYLIILTSLDEKLLKKSIFKRNI